MIDKSSDVTLVFTVRIDSRERLENLRSTLCFYRSAVGAPMMVLEADSISRLRDVMADEFPEVDYIFVADENPVFHRTRYINDQLRRATTRCAAVIDADVVVPPVQLSESLEALLSGRYVMVIPYDGRAVDHTPWRSDLFRQTRRLESLTSCDGYQQLMFGFVSVGGAFVVDIQSYRRLGWENEHFCGWGCEDHERLHRLDILGHRPLIVEGKIHHLNHPRGINSGNVLDKVVIATKREYCRICSMTPDELRREVDTWPWVRR